MELPLECMSRNPEYTIFRMAPFYRPWKGRCGQDVKFKCAGKLRFIVPRGRYVLPIDALIQPIRLLNQGLLRSLLLLVHVLKVSEARGNRVELRAERPGS